MTMNDKILRGTILDDQQVMSIAELASICACQVEWITELVEEGVIIPTGEDPSEWLFTGTSLVRVRTAIRLHRDLDINTAGIALAMELLDEIHELRERLKIVE